MNKLTERQMAWAARHDWFARRTDSGIIVVDRTYDSRTGVVTADELLWQGTFAELRAWAGY